MYNTSKMTSFAPRRLFALAFFLIAVFARSVSASDPKPPSPLKPVSLITLWSPQAQFAGYYVALEKGIYARYGLEVTILPSGPDYLPGQALKEGKADFAVLWLSSAVQQRTRGTDLVHLFQVFPRSALMLIAKKSGDIQSPRDLDGRKVSLWEGDLRIPSEALFRKLGIQPRVVSQAYTVNLFLAGGVDAVSAMWYNEYDTIVQSGLDEDELSAFFLSDQGFNFPEDGIYCLRSTCARDPAAASAFCLATMEGWLYAFSHIEETLDIVLGRMRRDNLPANRVHQRWMLERARDLMFPGPDKGFRRPGELDRGDFDLVCRELSASGLIENAPDYADFTAYDVQK